MKNALLTGKIHDIGHILDEVIAYKRQMADGISTPMIEDLYLEAKKAGALGEKYQVRLVAAL